jgi:hypothetical protein
LATTTPVSLSVSLRLGGEFMKVLAKLLICCAICASAFFIQASDVSAQQANAAAGQNAAPVYRDGQRDFDFEIGSWKIHLKRRLNPLTGSDKWVEFDGTSVTRRIWDGRSQIEEFETEGAAGHIEGLTLRLYNPQSHQWSLYWANAKDGTIVAPQIGEFRNGVGEFYGTDTLNGKFILIRFVWSNTTTNTPHFEQSYSVDGGKTWEVNWITDQTRVSDEAEKGTGQQNSATAGTGPQEAVSEGRDFDPLIGAWKYQLKRLSHPLTSSTTWVDLEGTGKCFKVWDGRAELDTIEVDGPTGHIEGLTLRLYNPQTHQWSLYWANAKVAKLDLPQVGEFKNGRGDFYAQDTISGRTILIRFDWSNLNTSTPHFEQSFSDDGGKTWEVNWITNQTRVPDESHKTD